MIHDLSIYKIFEENNSPVQFINLFSIETNANDLDVPEIFFSGDAFERESKAFLADYMDEQNMCDRCGAFLNRHFWDFSTSKLCPECEKILEDYDQVHHIKKAWDLPVEPELSPDEDIFLWD